MNKDARDNRANQLNPNNPAYHASRDHGGPSTSTSDGSKTTQHADPKTQDAPRQGGERK
jgi:hypothetical protein